METSTQTWLADEKTKEKAAETARRGQEAANRYAERAASRTPSLLFIGAALASIAASATLQLRGQRQWSLFVGQWAPSFLLFGVYTKLVKALGPD